MRSIPVERARRIALGAQGFADPKPSGKVDARHIRRVIDRIGLLQLDSVNVCVRSHYMPLFSRLGPYRQELIDEYAYERGELYEYWGHEASLLTPDTWPLLQWRMEEAQPWRQVKDFIAENPHYLEDIYNEVAEHGPISVSDLQEQGERQGPWWGYSSGKIALEWLFQIGRISCGHREKFKRYYDIPERVLPAEVLGADPMAKPDAQKELLRRSMRHHGIGTATDLADYYRIKMPDARPLFTELIKEGVIEEVEVKGWKQTAYLDTAAKIPRKIEGASLLTPFDPVVWFRDRGERLFDFHYRIEIYVPEPKRIYGYYVMPFMLDGEIVGRVDLKADRKAGRLLVKGSFAEEGVDRVQVASALSNELQSLALWQGLDHVVIFDNGDLAPLVGPHF